MRTVSQVLAEYQVEGMLVGGAVRDALLGRPVHDWDFAIKHKALPVARETANRLHAAYYTLDAARETGRVVMRKEDGSRMVMDFALCRGGSWITDLETRDFTLNAMAIPLTPPGALLDPLGGQVDLAARLVRATSPLAFQNDPVRVLRCVRMAATLDFDIEADTATWARQAAPLLDHVSAERVRDELVRLLATAAGLRQLDELGALERVLPEVGPMKDTGQSRPHHWNVFEHSLMLLEILEQLLSTLEGQGHHTELPVPPQVWEDVRRSLGPYRAELAEHLAVTLSDERTVLDALKLAALLHDCGKPATLSVEESGRTRFFDHNQVGADLAGARARALRLANVEIERVRTIIANHMRPQQLADSGLTARGVYRYFRDTGAAGVEIVLLALADHLATYGLDLQPKKWASRLATANALMSEYFGRLRAELAAAPLVNGKELIKILRLSPGPQIGQLLEVIREAQGAGEIHTRAEALELAKQIVNRK
ncbi:MAG: HD domain-containing protein [Thermoflexales bacterium]|nr:HD domain-containing protein [Thermoflexales bacterium]